VFSTTQSTALPDFRLRLAETDMQMAPSSAVVQRPLASITGSYDRDSDGQGGTQISPDWAVMRGLGGTGTGERDTDG
jgi:hypothetical protein